MDDTSLDLCLRINCLDLVQGYISMNENRTACTKRNILSLMRQFAFYLIRNGHHAWVSVHTIYRESPDEYERRADLCVYESEKAGKDSGDKGKAGK